MKIVSLSFRNAQLITHNVQRTTYKHDIFVSSPMGNKLVMALPGIGRTWGAQLTQNGFGHASQIFGQYLVLNQDKESFKSWLQQNCGIYPYYAGCVYSALREWSEQYYN